jgi:hypothetical protein
MNLRAISDIEITPSSMTTDRVEDAERGMGNTLVILSTVTRTRSLAPLHKQHAAI